MVHPRHVRSRGKQDLKLCTPAGTFQGQESRLKMAEPIGMKINVLCFVFQDERARFFQHWIARPCLQQTVIGGAEQFCDDEKLNFKFESERVPDQAEER